MTKFLVTKVADLLASNQSGKIRCRNTNNVVRHIERYSDTQARLVAGDGTEVLLLYTMPVRYEPWTMDRGSILIDGVPNLGTIKLCTELDLFENEVGDQFEITVEGGMR